MLLVPDTKFGNKVPESWVIDTTLQSSLRKSYQMLATEDGEHILVQ